MPDERFLAVADADELWDGEMESYHVGDREILLVRLDGQYHAYDGVCPHQDTPLVEGRLEGGSLICSAHEWEFDAATGLGINPAGACLKRYEVLLSSGRVFVSRTATAASRAPG